MKVSGMRAMLLACLTLSGCATMFSDGSDIAQQWVGYTVDAWQEKWRGIDPQVFDTSTPGQKGYYMWFGVNEHYETNYWQSAVGQDTNGTMIMQNNSATNFVPARHECDLYFYANAQRVITGYKLQGRQCGRYLHSWGGPRHHWLFGD